MEPPVQPGSFLGISMALLILFVNLLFFLSTPTIIPAFEVHLIQRSHLHSLQPNVANRSTKAEIAETELVVPPETPRRCADKDQDALFEFALPPNPSGPLGSYGSPLQVLFSFLARNPSTSAMITFLSPYLLQQH
jgi:hypothetical protein